MIWKYSLSFCGASFHFLVVVFETQQFLSLMGVSLVAFGILVMSPL